ncbi:N-acetylmuramoyl-L-alanine amidase [Bacillus haynesii]|nr:N-acetylmuramoyl-L-alanine amidase [Bacillus haynesii]MCY8758878.1 N-acetylmuramoyl-L-alanine amidase [Bacillus haynesii]MCY9274836.1 N-acetylmuramoyl-L-alanine amidase [Bacillus haynesii]MCY9402108.1 N-acetylmuramoyl-L-alanine amidase [Bacillus haynesii]
MPENEVAYHVHDKKRCYVSFLKPNANTKSISVEMCVEKDGKIHSETVQNTAELVADLCRRYGLSTDKIVRHYDVTNKNFPAPWGLSEKKSMLCSEIKLYQRQHHPPASQANPWGSF